MSEYERHAEVMSVQCSRSQTGGLRSAKVKVEYFEYKEDENGEIHDHRNGENIRFKFLPSGPNLVLDGWKDASDHSGWVSTKVLRCLPAAEAAAESIPDVNEVESSADLLDLELNAGAEAWETAKAEQ